MPLATSAQRLSRKTKVSFVKIAESRSKSVVNVHWHKLWRVFFSVGDQNGEHDGSPIMTYNMFLFFLRIWARIASL